MASRSATEVRRSSGTRTVAEVNQIGYKGAAVRWTHTVSAVCIAARHGTTTKWRHHAL